MASGVAPAIPVSARATLGSAIDVDGRCDGLALSELLIPFHSFLVQQTAERWVVHARAPGCHGEPLAEAVRAIAEWQADRGLKALVRIASGGHGSVR